MYICHVRNHGIFIQSLWPHRTCLYYFWIGAFKAARNDLCWNQRSSMPQSSSGFFLLVSLCFAQGQCYLSRCMLLSSFLVCLELSFSFNLFTSSIWRWLASLLCFTFN